MTASLVAPLVHRPPRSRPAKRRQLPSFKAPLLTLRQAYARFAMLDLHR